MDLGLRGGLGYERMGAAEGRQGSWSRGYLQLGHPPRRANQRRFTVELNFASLEPA